MLLNITVEDGIGKSNVYESWIMVNTREWKLRMNIKVENGYEEINSG